MELILEAIDHLHGCRTEAIDADVVVWLAELMLMGFISFLLTVLQSSISKICVPLSVGDSWHPCKPSEEDDIAGHLEDPDQNPGGRRRLLQTAGSVRAFRRVLAAGGSSDTCPEASRLSSLAINVHIFRDRSILCVHQVLIMCRGKWLWFLVKPSISFISLSSCWLCPMFSSASARWLLVDSR